MKRKTSQTKDQKKFIAINASNNVYKAWGSKINDPLYNWTWECLTGFNEHVKYTHSKFMLVDPLGNDPIVVTGSANFSESSTTYNDENMLIIRGDKRVADIYYTEFNRLFSHYYFRSVMEKHKKIEDEDDLVVNLFLQEDDKWLEKYNTGTFLYKRVEVFKKMQGFTEIQ